MSRKPSCAQLLRLLESKDAQVSADAAALLREQVGQGEWMGALVAEWCAEGRGEWSAARSLQLLGAVREPHERQLLDRLFERLRAAPLQVMAVLVRVVHARPVWLAKLSQHPIFMPLLKCIKTSSQVLHLVTGLFLLSALLPQTPPLSASHQVSELCQVFIRAAELLQRELASQCAMTVDAGYSLDSEDLYSAHYGAALTSYFQCLYSLYPCNLLSHLRNHFAGSDKKELFAQVIRPLLQSVRLHPMLVVAARDDELARDRWPRAAADSLDALHVAADSAVCRCSLVAASLSGSARSSSTHATPQKDSAGLDGAKVSLRAIVLPPSAAMSTTPNGQAVRAQTEPAAAAGNRRMSTGARLPPAVVRRRRVVSELARPSAPPQLWSPSLEVGLSTPPGSRAPSPPLRRAAPTRASFRVFEHAGVEGSPLHESPEPLKQRRATFSQAFARIFRSRDGGQRTSAPSAPPPPRGSGSFGSAVRTRSPGALLAASEVAVLPRRQSGASLADEAIEADEDGEQISQLPSDQSLTESAYQADDSADQSLLGSGDQIAFQLDTASDSPAEIENATETEAAKQSEPVAERDTSKRPLLQTSDSVVEFMTKMNRIRFNSYCVVEPSDSVELPPSPTASPADAAAADLIRSVTLRKRSISCPDTMDVAKRQLLGSTREQSANTALVDSAQATPPDTSTRPPPPNHLQLDQFPYLPLMAAFHRIPDSPMTPTLMSLDCSDRVDSIFALRHDIHVAQMAGQADAGAVTSEAKADLLSKLLSLSETRLSFERFRQEQFSHLCKRLFARLKHQQTADDERRELRQRIRSQEMEIQNLITALTEYRKMNVHLKDEHGASEYSLSCQLQQRVKENETLLLTIESLRGDAEELNAEIERLRRQVGLAKQADLDTEQRLTAADRARCLLDDERRESAELRLRLAAAADRLADERATAAALAESEATRACLEERVAVGGRARAADAAECERLLGRERARADANGARAAELQAGSRVQARLLRELHAHADEQSAAHQLHLDAAEQKFRALLAASERQEQHIAELYALIGKDGGRLACGGGGSGGGVAQPAAVDGAERASTPLPIPIRSRLEEIVAYGTPASISASAAPFLAHTKNCLHTGSNVSVNSP